MAIEADSRPDVEVEVVGEEVDEPAPGVVLRPGVRADRTGRVQGEPLGKLFQVRGQGEHARQPRSHSDVGVPLSRSVEKV